MDKQKLLRLLESDAKLSAAELAEKLGESEEAVVAQVAAFEADGVILGYQAQIDWEKTKRENVTAMIELKIVPKRGEGFGAVAERIKNYPEVRSLYLMSGGYDILVILEGKSLKEVAMFVAKKLATMDGVTSTATHFVLSKYKDKGVVFGSAQADTRRMYSYD